VNSGLKDLLDGDLFQNILFPYFLFFSDASILPVSQLQTQQVMTSQISSHMEYLIQAHYILVLILYSKSMTNVTMMAGFNTI